MMNKVTIYIIILMEYAIDYNFFKSLRYISQTSSVIEYRSDLTLLTTCSVDKTNRVPDVSTRDPVAIFIA